MIRFSIEDYTGTFWPLHHVISRKVRGINRNIRALVGYASSRVFQFSLSCSGIWVA